MSIDTAEDEYAPTIWFAPNKRLTLHKLKNLLYYQNTHFLLFFAPRLLTEYLPNPS